MKTCVVERNRSGLDARSRAVRAPDLPSSAICWSLVFRAETSAISAITNTPLMMINSRMTIIGVM